MKNPSHRTASPKHARKKSTSAPRHYHPTESKFKGGAEEMFVTYDLPQQTRGGNETLYPKVKRVYIAGKVKDSKLGDFEKRTGRIVHGMIIEYEQSRKSYSRRPFTAVRGKTKYQVASSSVGKTSQKFKQVVEVPVKAKHVAFYKNAGKLPQKYQHALQNVR